MPIVYRLGDVFCLPSQGPGETWGLAINEAMASGRPVIASNKCGGSIDLLEEQAIFDPHNMDSLIIALNKKLNYKDHTIKQYDIKKIAIALENNL